MGRAMQEMAAVDILLEKAWDLANELGVSATELLEEALREEAASEKEEGE